MAQSFVAFTLGSLLYLSDGGTSCYGITGMADSMQLFVEFFYKQGARLWREPAIKHFSRIWIG